jgi:tRNA(fMet)-specific endonuclease VapC
VSYLLDSSAAIDLIRGHDLTCRAAFADAVARGRRIALATIALLELRVGVAKSADPARNKVLLDELLAGPVEVWPFDLDDVAEAALVRVELERAGLGIGPYDTLIAGQARARGLTVVASNLREFARVPGLATVDWSKERSI